jgi:hypothetical protein
MRRRASSVQVAIRLVAALAGCAVAIVGVGVDAAGASGAVPTLGAAVQIAPGGGYALARASANGRAALIEQDAPPGQPGMLLIWRAGASGLERTPVRGQPLYISPDGRAILAACGGAGLCSWHQGQARGRERDLSAYCPAPPATASTVIRSSPGARALLLTCLSTGGEATVILRRAGGRLTPTATLRGFEGQAISEDGASLILTRQTSTWVDHRGQLRLVARSAPPFAVSQNAAHLAYVDEHTRTGIEGGTFDIYNTNTRQRRTVQIACPPPALRAPCFQGGFLSDDGKLLELTAQPSPEDPTAGLPVAVDAENGALSPLGPPGPRCEVQGLSAEGGQALYRCSTGIFMRAISGD